ncbi:molybdopterin-dependent oxidoreductase [Gephyromycinifex aptenodytis]|uniref:molybdopterin-dependent oxidoreductase n=1 Tax=Gephyromycinifex aptenodytis TaxID=2716227 RepID=UPI001446111C|nr:molybdopterin-dependent oxidoreductase [Gephyromycinifex aptenodytis]
MSASSPGGVPEHGRPHATHWGSFRARTDGSEINQVTPWDGDSAPSPLLDNIPGSVTHRSRVARPAVRRGWWEHGPGPTHPQSGLRGSDDFLRPPWDEVLDALAQELRRVIDSYGNAAIFGGSYGWASAGRFHHAQSQLHRFLNLLGGYTASVNSYSTGAAEVILPRVAAPESVFAGAGTTWDVIAAHTGLLVAFGGLPLRNSGTNSGGVGDHPAAEALRSLTARGGRIVSISPLADDTAELPGVQRIAPRPGTDVALMLALAYTLLEEGLADVEFARSHCVGFEEFAAYLRGRDGQVKTPAWAAQICDLPAEVIVELARSMAGGRTLITVAWSLQRTQHGEQAPWAGLALAALLGQIGLPGGGFGHGYASMNKPGLSPSTCTLPRLPQGHNPVTEIVPVAALSELLLNPGAKMPYDGRTLRLPDIRLVHWAGGNPFHHAQDLGRLRRALQRPDTVVVHDPYWTPMARHADIVLPSTTSYERQDITGSRNGALLVAMHALTPAHEQSRDDYDVLADLARRLGVYDAFTQGRTATQWVEHLYESWRQDLAAGRLTPPGTPRPEAPPFAQFWEQGFLRLPTVGPLTLFEQFRADPVAHPLPTPSGRLELFSAAIAALELPDCPGHPTWLEPAEWLGSPLAQRYPLHLIANQPAHRLHSQLDHGALSRASKIAGREPARLNPGDAHARDISDGDVIRVFNDRGACLAGAHLDARVRPGVVQLSTGAWFDPLEPADLENPPLCVHGNPNVLTSDRRSSDLAQASTGQHALVQVERWQGQLPPVRVFDPPPEPSADHPSGTRSVPAASGEPPAPAAGLDFPGGRR